ncbi:xanthine dehydrogenase FAD-binding subunit XdhB [Oscillospiraceae bacterium OttesenSCG-928-F05]|nr:xanthine dehydrogenase FAD-binding subunit XdhB [Oscillospiraceae bacterium OttesenSCG-928-F05]
MYDFMSVCRAASVEDAAAILEKDDNAVLIAGGTDVLIRIREGKFVGKSLVSIGGLDALRGVEKRGDGAIVIGPCTTFTELSEHPVIREHIPMFGHAISQVGGPQIRNVGTIGGNVCNGATSADSAPSLFALDAELRLQGPSSERTVPIQAFYAGPGRVKLERGEVLTAIIIRPESYMGFSGHAIKYARRNAMDIATLGLAVSVKLDGAKEKIQEMRLAFGVAAPTPVRCPKAEEVVKGMAITEELFETVGRIALEDVTPRGSWRASKEFRLQLVQELSGRCLKQAILNGGGHVPC